MSSIFTTQYPICSSRVDEKKLDKKRIYRAAHTVPHPLVLARFGRHLVVCRYINFIRIFIISHTASDPRLSAIIELCKLLGGFRWEMNEIRKLNFAEFCLKGKGMESRVEKGISDSSWRDFGKIFISGVQNLYYKKKKTSPLYSK